MNIETSKITVYTAEEKSAFIDKYGRLHECYVRGPITWSHAGPEEDPSAKLTAVVNFFGCLMHATAYASVYKVESGSGPVEIAYEDRQGCDWQELAGADCEDLWHAHGMEGCAETLVIAGRRYAVFICPFCE